MFRLSSEDTALLKRVLPFESCYTKVSGYEMHYLDEGKGPVVLLLHGNPTWSFMFRHLITALKTSCRVIAPDFIGLGLSERPHEKRFRAIDRVAHLEEFLHVLDIESFSLVMHDWGGSIGSMLAAREPLRVERLVYLNTTLTEIESLPEIIKRATTPIVGKILTKYSTSFLRLLTEMGVAKRLPSDLRQAYLLPYRSVADRQAIWDFVADIPFSSDHPSHGDLVLLGEKLPSLAEKPVQIVWGLKDPCFHREMLSKVARHFPQARVYELPEASHLLLEDAPEKTAEVISEFLISKAEALIPRTPREVPLVATELNAFYKGFVEHVKTAPGQQAVIEPSFSGERPSYSYSSYEELDALINQYQRGLHSLGLEKGDRVLMLVSPGVDFLALNYAVMASGAVPVLVDPGVGREKLLSCIEDAEAHAFIASVQAFALRLLRRNLFRRFKFQLAVVDWPLPLVSTLSYLKRFSKAPIEALSNDGTALIAYTSGATGTPKGVIYTNQMIEAQLRIFTELFGLKSGSLNLSLLPAFSLFSLSAGIGSVFAPLDQTKPLSLDASIIVEIIQHLRVQYSFGSPSLWNKIADYALRTGKTLASLEQVFMAGAPVSSRVREKVQQIAVEGRVFTPYGATEALPVTLAPAEELEKTAAVKAKSGELGTLVGKAISGVSVKIIKPSEAVLEDISQASELMPLCIGEIVVKGKNVSPAYLHCPDANAKAKIPDAKGGNWHCMGDMGYLDEEDNLYFCGRKAHAVHTAARVFYSIPCERIFNAHPQVQRSALVALDGGTKAGIVIEPLSDAWPSTEDAKRRFAAELRALGAKDPVSAAIEEFFFHESFPVDGRHNVKIFREQLSVWASKQREGKT